uniref:Tower domain-containing protein n=1 Tax=Aegilops tauschii subsp. strangulata TaxID=200361 RepID=A0A453E4C8_AEGTS
PLAFKCIKASGGRVPRTLVGVARIYPVLYKERLPDGSSIVRSERMERKALQLYHQSEEGAKICKMLEQAAEPEVMMAGLTSEQMISFSSYQAKQKVCTIIPRIHQLVLGKLRKLCHYISGS